VKQFQCQSLSQSTYSTPPRKHRSQHLVLVGGGHSHAIALQQWCEQFAHLDRAAQPAARVTLITNVRQTPYSGMLPGYVAGLYEAAACHIDLEVLARRAQIDFLRDQAIGLDLKHRLVFLASNRAIAYDWLSINIGSTPALETTLGAQQFAIPVKPVPRFLGAWQALLDRVQRDPKQLLRLTIVGGGAGGVELALAMSARLHHLLDHPNLLQLRIIQREGQLLPTYPAAARAQLEAVLKARGVQIFCKETVTQVDIDRRVHCQSGLILTSDLVFWVTQASAPDWIARSGLLTDEDGFIAIDSTLRSRSHPFIFATGDIATNPSHPRPKAGVFAVRQGVPLFRNWLTALNTQVKHTSDATAAILEAQAWQHHTPQARNLSLLGTGDRQAIATWGQFSWGASRYLWQWKDQIDRQFMAKFPQGFHQR